MRIIGGQSKGRRLQSLEGNLIRPTSVRIRKGVFDILFQIEDKKVLDLYAGLGAFGLEALSRGALFCTFVDGNRRSIDVIEKNIEICGFNSRACIIKKDVIKSIDILDKNGRQYDIIFMDPPYFRGLIEKTLERLYSSTIIHEGVKIIAQHDVNEVVETDLRWRLLDSRRYGSNRVVFLTPKIV